MTTVYTTRSRIRSQNRTGSGTVRFIGAAITQVELSFETERWAACENTNVNIDCKIVLVLYRMHRRWERGVGRRDDTPPATFIGA